jgi:hypothetical protein
MKKIFRKIQHKRFVESYINDLRWESLNTMIVASSTQWNDDVVRLLDNNAKLIRKYERRRRWLRF